MTDNIDQNEVQKFAAIAEQWWDPTGDFKPLHVINPIRAEYISNKIDLQGKKFWTLDVEAVFLQKHYLMQGLRFQQ